MSILRKFDLPRTPFKNSNRNKFYPFFMRESLEPTLLVQIHRIFTKMDLQSIPLRSHSKTDKINQLLNQTNRSHNQCYRAGQDLKSCPRTRPGKTGRK